MTWKQLIDSSSSSLVMGWKFWVTSGSGAKLKILIRAQRWHYENKDSSRYWIKVQTMIDEQIHVHLTPHSNKYLGMIWALGQSSSWVGSTCSPQVQHLFIYLELMKLVLFLWNIPVHVVYLHVSPCLASTPRSRRTSSSLRLVLTFALDFEVYFILFFCFICVCVNVRWLYSSIYINKYSAWLSSPPAGGGRESPRHLSVGQKKRSADSTSSQFRSLAENW